MLNDPASERSPPIRHIRHFCLSHGSSHRSHSFYGIFKDVLGGHDEGTSNGCVIPGRIRLSWLVDSSLGQEGWARCESV